MGKKEKKKDKTIDEISKENAALRLKQAKEAREK